MLQATLPVAERFKAVEANDSITSRRLSGTDEGDPGWLGGLNLV